MEGCLSDPLKQEEKRINKAKLLSLKGDQFTVSQSPQVDAFCIWQSCLEYNEAKGEGLIVQQSICVCVLISESVYLHEV